MPANKVSQREPRQASFASLIHGLLPGLALRGQGPSAAQIGALEAFACLMLDWNKSLNLTGARGVEDLVEDHLGDPLVAAEEVAQGARVVDVGAGGGLPGVALAILRPDLRLVLIEPRAKRVAFLRTATRELGLKGVEVFGGRVEQFEPSGRPSVAISRATFPPELWVPMGKSLVAPNPASRVFAFLGDREAPDTLPSPLSTRSYRLPKGQTRVLLGFGAP